MYAWGAWEDTLGVSARKLYSFNGQVVAQRDNSGVTYLHGDHLGSVSVATNSGGALISKQEFDPWGKARSGNVNQTTLNYTGQRLDSTGLLFYNARYYDPAIGRFISADTIVPGADALSMMATGKGGGPSNPQQLNRYAYVVNNPLRWTDPTGHANGCEEGCGGMNNFGGGGGEGGAEGGGGGGGGEASVTGGAEAEIAAESAKAGESTGGYAGGGGGGGDWGEAGGNAPTSNNTNRPIHSRYADGTPVYDGEQPSRLPSKVPSTGEPQTRTRLDPNNNRVYQERDYNSNGERVRDVDHTNPTYPNGRPRPDHPGPPHQHRYLSDPNNPRGSRYHGPAEPVDPNFDPDGI